MLYALITVLIIGYIVGCVHGSNAAQLLSGVNLKETGFGNAGASNATLSLGWKYGVLVGVIDIGKGIVAILLTRYILIEYTSLSLDNISILLYITGAAVILGHNFPMHMKFRGGKGTASLIGIFLALDWKFGLIAVFALIITSLLTNYLVIGVFVLYITFGITAFLFESTIYPLLITMMLFLIAVSLHIENLKRIRLGVEPSVRAVFKKKTK